MSPAAYDAMCWKADSELLRSLLPKYGKMRTALYLIKAAFHNGEPEKASAVTDKAIEELEART